MQNIIPITPTTIDLVQALNNGVRPEREDAENFFVFRGAGVTSEIITFDELRNSGKYPEWMACEMIYYVGN